MHNRSDRLQPIVVETRRGPEQLLRILESLARVELTDGLSFRQLIAETGCRLPRDATVIAVLPSLSAETATALGDLRRRGMAVSRPCSICIGAAGFVQATKPVAVRNRSVPTSATAKRSSPYPRP